ncbi:MAG TPA: lipoyl(octanoyl) transferase LipB [Bacteroidota bacterium]|nr:lipoyl(octanoyl) transferase LipB [Bacteroidota bacterium]
MPSTSEYRPDPRTGAARAGILRVVDLGPTGYDDCWKLQRDVFDSRGGGRCSDTLLLTSHDHVYTLGKGADDDHLLASTVELRLSGAGVVRTDRGGDVTYHGPGQLVGYPILDLRGHYLDIHRYLRDLEEVLIAAIGDFGLKGEREEGFTGVWVGGEKIAAIGVKVSRWITMHGFALNVNTDLKYFDRIIPCGIGHRGVTSMEKILGDAVPVRDVLASAAGHFAGKFHLSPLAVSPQEICGTETTISETTQNG